jgi:hypothetical protein
MAVLLRRRGLRPLLTRPFAIGFAAAAVGSGGGGPAAPPHLHCRKVRTEIAISPDGQALLFANVKRTWTLVAEAAHGARLSDVDRRVAAQRDPVRRL